jgi:segregation and condensation protein B
VTERDGGTPATADESTMDEPVVDGPAPDDPARAGEPTPETAAAIEEDAPVEDAPVEDAPVEGAPVEEEGPAVGSDSAAAAEEDAPVEEDGPAPEAGSTAGIEEDPPVETEPVEADPTGSEPIDAETDGDPVEAELADGEPANAETDGEPVEAEVTDGDSVDAEVTDGDPVDGRSAEDESADGEPAEGESARSAALSFEESAAAWVPPWARALPDLIIEPAADDPLPPRHFFVPEPEPEPEPDVEPVAEDEPAEPEPVVGTMEEGELRSSLEAIMLVVDEPVAEVLLAQVLEEPTDRVAAMLRTLAQEYTDTGRGFELRHAAGGWRLYTRAAYAPYVERFVLDGQQTRLTQAALETLAVVAYKQPVTRSRISAIRGVNCDGVLKTLVTRGLVEECGQEPDSGAFLYRTTPLFLEKLGINSVEELPSLAPFLPDNVDELDGVR